MSVGASLKHDGRGDTNAVAQMVWHASSKYGANANRVYAFGTSSSAMMTEALLGVYADMFIASVSVAGVVGTMDPNAESEIAMREMRDKMLHVAIVIESEGVLASLLKAVIRTLNSVAWSSLLSLAADLEEAPRVVAAYVKEQSETDRACPGRATRSLGDDTPHSAGALVSKTSTSAIPRPAP